MDVVLVGLPGSGKTAVGRRLAQRHRAAFIDLDELIEAEAGRPIPEIFAQEGEAAFRALERAAVAGLGPPDPGPVVRRVVATGGGAVVDPRNRWALYRGRGSVWLDGRPEVLAQRLRRSPNVRPLVTGRDPIGTIRDLAARRERFYAAARLRLSGMAEVGGVVETLVAQVTEWTPERLAQATTLVRAHTASARSCWATGSPSKASKPPWTDGGPPGDRRVRTGRMDGRRRAPRPRPRGTWAVRGARAPSAG